MRIKVHFSHFYLWTFFYILIFLYNNWNHAAFDDFFQPNMIIQNFLIIISFCINIICLIILPIEILPNIPLEMPISNDFKKGEIYLGKILYDQKIFCDFHLNLEDLKRHILIYGQTGTGKTSFVKTLLINLNRLYPKIKFILFEFKGEYDNLKRNIPDLQLIKPGNNFTFNLFDKDIFPEDLYPEILFDGFKSCKILDENSEFTPQMEFLMINALKRLEKIDSLRNWDIFLEIIDQLIKENDPKIPQIGQTGIGIKNRLRRYYDGPLRKVFSESIENNTLSSLINQNVIVDLGNILKIGGNKEDVIFFANLILKWIWHFNINREPSENLQHITIFEDSSVYRIKAIIRSFENYFIFRRYCSSFKRKRGMLNFCFDYFRNQ